MAINLTDVNGDGLFDLLGKLGKVLNTLNANRGTLDTAAETFWTQLSEATLGLELSQDLEGFPASVTANAGANDSFGAAIADAAQRLVLHYVTEEYPSTRENLEDALRQLLVDMVTQGYYVQENTINITAAGDLIDQFGALAIFGADTYPAPPYLANAGGIYPHLIKAETLVDTIEAIDSRVHTLRIQGSPAPRARTSEDYPGGSGADLSLTAATPADSLVPNADFSADIEQTGEIPSWVRLRGIAAQAALVAWQTCSVAIAGTPSSGGYALRVELTNDGTTGLVAYGETRAEVTTLLAWNASQSEVESALQAIDGLESVTVATTGTSPNFTHTITFEGVHATIGVTVFQNALNTGTITPTMTAWSGATQVTRWLQLSAHATDRATLLAPVEVEADTLYLLAAHFRRLSGSGNPSGLKLALCHAPASGASSLSGVSRNNWPGSAIEFPVSFNSDGRSWTGGMFAVSADVAAKQLYVAIDKHTADNSRAVAVEAVMLVPATQLYVGGPWVAAVQGYAAMTTVENFHNVSVTNNYAADWQKAAEQLLSISDFNLALPTEGATLLNDSLLA